MQGMFLLRSGLLGGLLTLVIPKKWGSFEFLGEIVVGTACGHNRKLLLIEMAMLLCIATIDMVSLWT
jgi:hypothetical protein